MNLIRKMNCIHNVNQRKCTHPDIKRSFFGFGTRLCKDWVFEKHCDLKEGRAKQAAPPPPIKRRN